MWTVVGQCVKCEVRVKSPVPALNRCEMDGLMSGEAKSCET